MSINKKGSWSSTAHTFCAAAIIAWRCDGAQVRVSERSLDPLFEGIWSFLVQKVHQISGCPSTIAANESHVHTVNQTCVVATMAKPSDNGHHHGHHRKPPLCQEDSTEKLLYRNIKPKVGSQYQTKIPKQGAALSSRPAPLRFSTDLPHLTVSQAQNENDMDIGEIIGEYGVYFIRRMWFKSLVSARFGDKIFCRIAAKKRA